MRDSLKVVSLFDLTGTWSQPFVDAGYNVLRYDILRNPEEDVLKIDPRMFSQGEVTGVLAAPPCTYFTNSSSRFWKTYDADGRTAQGLSLVLKTLELVEAWQPQWWAMENPPGRLPKLIGIEPVLRFHPYHFAGYVDDPIPRIFRRDGNPHLNEILRTNRYKKFTCLYGNFNIPQRNELPPLDTFAKGQSVMSLLSPGPERPMIRAKTPEGFAKAFFTYNNDTRY